jgi:uncharacterized membrane protein YeaQ/YmgE (transglycosylase-associated protein family)
VLSFLWLLVIGLIAGLLARVIVPGKDSMGWLTTLVLGVLGSVLLLVIYNRLAARRSIARNAGPA